MVEKLEYSNSARRLRLIAFITITLVALTMPGCDLTGGLGQHIESSVDKAVKVIDDGIHDIEINSSTWQAILQRVADQLPEDISETVRVDAQSLVNRSIATAGVEFRCNADFLGNRAIQSLRHLKAELLNQNPPPIPPAFCQVDPASIDLKVPPKKWSTVMIYGYDLDHRDKANALLSVFLVGEHGEKTPLPENRVGRTTHYQMALNLGGMAPQLYRDQIRKITTSWDGTSAGYPEVVVVPWERQRLPEPVTVGSTGPYIPRHAGNGDRDFDTHDDQPTSLRVSGEMRVTDSALYNRVYMHAREVPPDHTEVEGRSGWATVYSAPAGWKIVEVRPSTTSVVDTMVTSRQSDDQPIELSRPSGEVVDRFEVWVDREGDEAGSWSRITVHWRPLQVTIEQVVPEWLR